MCGVIPQRVFYQRGYPIQFLSYPQCILPVELQIIRKPVPKYGQAGGGGWGVAVLVPEVKQLKKSFLFTLLQLEFVQSLTDPGYQLFDTSLTDLPVKLLSQRFLLEKNPAQNVEIQHYSECIFFSYVNFDIENM